MNQTYEIIWAVAAENDLKEIIEYIATDSPVNALARQAKLGASCRVKVPVG